MAPAARRRAALAAIARAVAMTTPTSTPTRRFRSNCLPGDWLKTRCADRIGRSASSFGWNPPAPRFTTRHPTMVQVQLDTRKFPVDESDAKPSYSWLMFARRSGPDGQAWIDALRHSRVPRVLKAINASLDVMRERRLDEAERMLDDLRETIDAMAPVGPLSPHIADRWFYGAVAYLHYVRRDFDASVNALEQAEAAARAAIRRHPFLLPLARVHEEFAVQRARICRNRRDWDGMHHHLERTEQMLTNDLPLCDLASDDGARDRVAPPGSDPATTRDVYYRAVLDFCRDCLDEDEAAGFDAQTNLPRRLDEFRNFTGQIPAPSGFVIKYH
ncbi:MAG: hypothetical protein AAF772_04365 [Acidobacteriota bacterium]